MKEITGQDYRVTYDPTTATITCQGMLRLYGAEGYVSLEEFEKSKRSKKASQQQDEAIGTSIMSLLDDALAQSPSSVTLNIRELQTLNSSGVNILSKFVIKARNHGLSQLIIQGTDQFSWQRRVADNLQRLMPDILLEWE